MVKKFSCSTKIVATIGPSSENEKRLLQMMKAGMSVARLNFSHGTHDIHLRTIQKIRLISKNENRPITILQDLSGPKIRLSEIPSPIELKKNEIVTLSWDKTKNSRLLTDFKDLPLFIKVNDPLLIDDGLIELKITQIQNRIVTCKVISPGIVKSRKGINLPNASVTSPVFTSKDRADLIFGIENGVDMIAMSFVSSHNNITPIRKILQQSNTDIPVIAKIERKVALSHIEKIIENFDGIMIARGDLGVEIPAEDVPLIQKKLIKMANDKGKLVITATQMLDSMITHSRPTRAEASDVSNAILDGTDCIMLSGETACGSYPVQAVNMMARIARSTEESSLYRSLHHHIDIGSDHTKSIVKSAAEIANDLEAKYILVFTYSGKTALYLSKFRPGCPIIAFTPQSNVVNQMASSWGVSPYLMEFSLHTDEMILKGEELLKLKKMVHTGDLVITIAGITPMRGATNMLRISKIS